MDVLSLIGIIMAFVAIIGGNYLEGGHLGALANGPAALIVIGGTIGAALLQSPMSSFKRAMQILVWIIFPPRVDLPGGIDRVVNWSLTARKEGLLGLEGVADAEPDSYARKGLQLLVDGAVAFSRWTSTLRKAVTSTPPKSLRAWAAMRRPSVSSVRSWA